MNKSDLKEFQDNVSEILIRHKSLLDIITKLQESCARVNRAVIKSASDCGCVQIHGKIQEIPSDVSYEDIHAFLSNNVSGELCDVCKEKIVEEVGNHIFYITALCGSINLNIDDIFEMEANHLKALGKFSLY